MRKYRYFGLVIMLASTAVMAVHTFITPLSDWVVRVNGIILLLTVFALTFTTMRANMKK